MELLDGSTFDKFASIAKDGKASLKYLATSFDASLRGRWREHVVAAHRYLILRAKDMSGKEIYEDEDEDDMELRRLLRSTTSAIQAVRVSPRARSRLLSDCLCPKPWSSDLLLYILLALISSILPDDKSTLMFDEEENPRVGVFTGSRNANDLSDNETYICALTLSHECMYHLDLSIQKTWEEYLLLERRIYKMVLFTDMDSEIHHTAVFENRSDLNRDTQGQKKTVLLHSMAAISAAMWGRRVSHSCIGAMTKEARPSSLHKGIDPSLSVLKDMLLSAHRDWRGTRYELAICKGRCNTLCRAHDTEMFSFLSNGVAGTGASMGESVEMAFMPVPQVLKTIHGSYEALKFPDNEVFCDCTAILYLSNSILKQKFDIPLLDNYVLIEPDVTRNINAISAARYRQPCIVCGPGGNWGVLHWKSDCGTKRKASSEGHGNECFAIFTPGFLLNADYPLVATLALWLKLYCVHHRANGGALAGKALENELVRLVDTI